MISNLLLYLGSKTKLHIWKKFLSKYSCIKVPKQRYVSENNPIELILVLRFQNKAMYRKKILSNLFLY
jgi:hypothetical protein